MKFYDFSGSMRTKKYHVRNSLRDEFSLRGVGAFICPKCGKVIFAKCNITKEIYLLDENLDDDGYVYMNEFQIKCPYCAHKYSHIGNPLDPNIAESIAELNYKGYMTRYSCEGHENNYHHNDSAYINFAVDIASTVEKYPLPPTWYMSDNYTIRSFKNLDLEDRVVMLWKWVNCLPIYKE